MSKLNCGKIYYLNSRKLDKEDLPKNAKLKKKTILKDSYRKWTEYWYE